MLIKFINTLVDRKVLWATLFVGNLCFAQIALDKDTQRVVSLSSSLVSTFISSEAQALEGLRNGTMRLERLCATPLKPATEKPSDQALRALRHEVQERGTRIHSAAERAVSLTQFHVDDMQQKSQQACTPLNRIKTWLSTTTSPTMGTCEQSKATYAQATALNKAAKEWLSIHEERQRLYGKLMQLETAGCTSSGFAQRMFQTHEQLMGSHENQALELFESVLRQNTPNLESKP